MHKFISIAMQAGLAIYAYTQANYALTYIIVALTLMVNLVIIYKVEGGCSAFFATASLAVFIWAVSMLLLFTGLGADAHDLLFNWDLKDFPLMKEWADKTKPLLKTLSQWLYDAGKSPFVGSSDKKQWPVETSVMIFKLFAVECLIVALSIFIRPQENSVK